MTFEDATIIDASGLILGRMASIIAKRLLMGEHIIIVNAEKAVVSGKRLSIIQRYKRRLEIGHPGKGPIHPRRPDNIIRKTIKGMLPRYKDKGRFALKRLRVYIGVPEELKDREFQTINEARANKLKCPYTTVAEIAREIGWRG